ncbi:DUF2075 domain-containing protein [Nocardia beijingensis]|uniref:DUF2075 domain-containing protein n=1 Tax=Nocardia beijingensis TaxID=95162 RepID=A0ABW7WI23_9NOCA
MIIVTGGPGSGKSMIAVSLLFDLHNDDEDDYRVLYATGSVAITETMRRYPGKGSREFKDLFVYYRDLSLAKPNRLDVLICDEAHRVRKTSTFRRQKKELRTGRPQLDELMTAARVPVFLLDEHQVVRPDEVGTVEEIVRHAGRKGYRIHHIELDGQFRCGGSAAYDEWVLQLLGLRTTKPTPWTGGDFDVRVANSPQEMEDFLRAKHLSGEKARITAGYCWPWSKPRADGTLVPDVKIGDWSKPWNKKDSAVSGVAPPASFWATDRRGFEQVGCIYTAQGFEYDWAGVILGPDIVYNGEYLVVRRKSKVAALNGTKSAPTPDAIFDRMVCNTYKVLLTRGLKGVVIYSVDPATQEFISGPIGSRGKIEALLGPDLGFTGEG